MSLIKRLLPIVILMFCMVTSDFLISCCIFETLSSMGIVCEKYFFEFFCVHRLFSGLLLFGTFHLVIGVIVGFIGGRYWSQRSNNILKRSET